MKRVQKVLFIAIALASGHWLNAQSKPATTTPAVATDKKLVIYNERAVNTAQLEFSPTFYEDGIVFVSSQVAAGKEKIFDKHINRKTMSIYAAFRGEDGKLLAPKLFADELVSLLHEGPLTFDQFNENIFFTRNNSKGTKTNYADGVSRLKIYSARRDKKAWIDVTELPFNDDKSDACHPTISINGERLYFSSNRPGGYGGMDLYVCEKVNGKWGIPTNLGPKINTAKNETFPYIHNSGMLFFASDGLAGQGGIDIFYTSPLSTGGFDTPKNIGKSFNTNKDDFGLIVDADMKNGYFTSGRAGGAGEDDIYSFSAPNGLLSSLDEEEANGVSGLGKAKMAGMTIVHVLDRKTGKEIESATVSFMNLCEITASDLMGSGTDLKMPSNGTFPIDNSNVKVIHKLTDVKGETSSKMPKGCKYIINVVKQEYATRQVLIKEDDTRTDIIILLDKGTDNVCVTANGVVIDKLNRPIPNAIVNVLDSKGETVSVTSDAKGRFTTCVRCSDNFRFQATKNDAISNAQLASTMMSNCNAVTTPLEIELQITDMDNLESAVLGDDSSMVQGKTYRLKNIYYNFNDASIRPDATRDLDNLVTLMKKFPDVEIELASHTDIRGTDEYNIDLSQRRASNAVLYLTKHGVDRHRVKAVGYGETRLKVKCTECSEYEHQRNRRTEVKIVKGGIKDKVKVLDNQPSNFTGDDKKTK